MNFTVAQPILAVLLPLVGAATLYRHNWFYPACMVIVGAHYLPFIFMYGMWQFAILAAALLGAGLAIALYFPHDGRLTNTKGAI